MPAVKFSRVAEGEMKFILSDVSLGHCLNNLTCKINIKEEK